MQIRRRVLFRRWALARCEKLVVPSHQLAALARGVWKLPANRVAYIPNGVDLARFTRLPRDQIPGFTRRPGELVIGTVAPLRPEKNIGRLIRVFADLDRSLDVRLVVAGDGGERRALEQLARELGIGDRVIFVGQVTPETVLGAFDIFALSSDTEQMPNALLEAMAAGRAIAAVDVGDVKATVCDENRAFIVPRDDGPAFTAAFVGCCAIRQNATSSAATTGHARSQSFPRNECLPTTRTSSPPVGRAEAGRADEWVALSFSTRPRARIAAPCKRPRSTPLPGRGFADPRIVRGDDYVLTLFPKHQAKEPAFEQFANGDFVFVCGTLIYDDRVGRAAAVAFYRDYGGPAQPRARAMGHYTVILRKAGQTEIIPDSFGGFHIFCDAGRADRLVVFSGGRIRP